MVRMAWKLRREGGGVKAEDEDEGLVGLLFFHFFSSICHQDHSSDQLHHDWNMGSEKCWHSVGVRFVLCLR
jgi:hypothetical protein